MAEELKKTENKNSDNTVSASPTELELTSIFGDPNDISNGYMGIVNSGGVSVNVYSIWIMNGKFYWEKLTKAI